MRIITTTISQLSSLPTYQHSITAPLSFTILPMGTILLADIEPSLYYAAAITFAISVLPSPATISVATTTKIAPLLLRQFQSAFVNSKEFSLLSQSLIHYFVNLLKFEDIFDVDHFIDYLKDDVRIVRDIPEWFTDKSELLTSIRSDGKNSGALGIKMIHFCCIFLSDGGSISFFIARAVGKVSSIVSRWGRLSQVLETSHLLFVDDTLLSFVRLLKQSIILDMYLIVR
ncbi:Protein PECTIC ARABINOGALACTAN synthesis-related [Vitis vinifera]|uniref:Protein PECTIC ARABINOGALACTAN synthesis-related n=1 Tax=Vitis vinifera TaxID=29760 RepID=A0A438J640_VITVI|nr:Protein PECTIC ARABINOGALACTAN synthesis-related [Vitis vinifera]